MRNIFRTGRPTNFKLGTQTEHEDPHRRQAPWPPRSKVKVARSCDASDRCWPISRVLNVLEHQYCHIGRTVPTSRAIMHTSFKVKGQGQQYCWDRNCVVSSGWPTKFKLGTHYTDAARKPASGQAPWPPRSKVKVARSGDASDKCWPISQERNVLETPKVVRRLSTSRARMRTSFKVKGQGRKITWRVWQVLADESKMEQPIATPKLVWRLSITRDIMCTSFKVKGLRSRLPGRLMLTQLMCNIFRTGIPTKFKLGTQTEQEDPHQQRAPWPPRSKVRVARSLMRLTVVHR